MIAGSFQKLDQTRKTLLISASFQRRTIYMPSAFHPPLQIHADAERQVSNAVHLRLLLRPERLLPQTQEEKGASEGRGG